MMFDFKDLGQEISNLLDRVQELADRPQADRGLNDSPESALSEPGQAVVLDGRPLSGKSSHAVATTFQAAMVQKLPVLVFSMALSAAQFTECLTALAGSIDPERLHCGDLENEDWPKLTRAIEILTTANVTIVDDPRITPNILRKAVLQFAASTGADSAVVVVDGVDFLRVPPSALHMSRAEFLADAANTLEALARELNCRVLAVRHRA